MISDASSIRGSDIFECKNCGDCCQGFGGTYVTQKNIVDIAAYLQMDPERILAEYCVSSGQKTVLAQKPDGFCVFWDKKCTIHPVKPRMCRAWPFIENILKAPENWDIMATACPGIKPDVARPALVACVRNEIERLEKHNVILP